MFCGVDGGGQACGDVGGRGRLAVQVGGQVVEEYLVT